MAANESTAAKRAPSPERGPQSPRFIVIEGPLRVGKTTRRGPSMTIKRGDCGPRSGEGARLAAVDSLAAIVWSNPQRDLGEAGVNGGDYSRVALTTTAGIPRFAQRTNGRSKAVCDLAHSRSCRDCGTAVPEK